MFAPRFALLSLLSVLVATLASAVTFSPEFEKTLSAGLDKLKQDIQEYPKLQAAVEGIPMDVASWAALSRDDIVTTLRFFSEQNNSILKNLLIVDPVNADKVSKFSDDTHSVIMSFVDNIKSGAFTSAPLTTTPAPAPAPTPAPAETTPEPTTMATPAETTPSPTVVAGLTTAPTASNTTETSSSEASSDAGSDSQDTSIDSPVSTTPQSSSSPVASPTPTSAASIVAMAPAAVGILVAVVFAMV